MRIRQGHEKPPQHGSMFHGSITRRAEFGFRPPLGFRANVRRAGREVGAAARRVPGTRRRLLITANEQSCVILARRPRLQRNDSTRGAFELSIPNETLTWQAPTPLTANCATRRGGLSRASAERPLKVAGPWG